MKKMRWFIQANSSVGGLIESLEELSTDIVMNFREDEENPYFWMIEVTAPASLMSEIEEIVSYYM